MNTIVAIAIVASWTFSGYIIYRQHKAISAMLDLTAAIASQTYTIKHQITYTQDAIEGLDKKIGETLKKEVTKMAFMGVKVR